MDKQWYAGVTWSVLVVNSSGRGRSCYQSTAARCSHVYVDGKENAAGNGKQAFPHLIGYV